MFDKVQLIKQTYTGKSAFVEFFGENRLFKLSLCLPHRLLINFANSLDRDQARQNVGSDLNLNC